MSRSPVPDAPGTEVDAQLEALYARADDFYGAQARFQAQRKRNVLLASLPRERFRRCYEPDCGHGELTVALAARCDSVLAADFSQTALRAAQARTAHLGNVTLERHGLPVDWPRAQHFDLMVLSALGYVLDLPAVQEIARSCATSLDQDGVLMVCDWLPDGDTRLTSTGAVHGALAAVGLIPLVTHAEDDFRLMVWSRDPRAVPQREDQG